MPSLKDRLPSWKDDLPSLEDIKDIFKTSEGKKVYQKTYLRAMPLNGLSDLDVIKEEVKSGKILILKITSLADKSIDDVKSAVKELIQFVDSIEGDIARLGEERVVICPSHVKIWREKSSLSNNPISTST